MEVKDITTIVLVLYTLIDVTNSNTINVNNKTIAAPVTLSSTYNNNITSINSSNSAAKNRFKG